MLNAHRRHLKTSPLHVLISSDDSRLCWLALESCCGRLSPGAAVRHRPASLSLEAALANAVGGVLMVAPQEGGGGTEGNKKGSGRMWTQKCK